MVHNEKTPSHSTPLSHSSYISIMINSKFTTIVLFFLTTFFLLTGCVKEGCTDENATNKSTTAKKDDGTCRYEGSVVLWIHDSSAQKMMRDTIQNLIIYVDGDVVGSLSVGQNFMTAPDCGAANTITLTRDLFSAKTRAFSYRILDDRSIKRFAGVLTFNGNTCEKNELVYFQ